MVQIIPALLALDEAEYKQKLDKIVDSGAFQNGWLQIDLMDGQFVANRSIGADVVAKYPTSLMREAQLMVVRPDEWIDQLVNAQVNRIVFPVENQGDIAGQIQHIKNGGVQVGLSLNPETEVAGVESLLDQIDLLLVMSVHPGFGGQEFIPESLDKIKEVARLRAKNNLKFIIEVDGGINDFVAKDLVQAGADNLVIGSHLIEGNIDENLEKIWQAINS